MGCAESLTVATCAIRSIVSSIAAGPTLQFSPTTCAPRYSSAGTNDSGAAPSRLLPSSSVVTCATIGQIADAPHRANRRANLVDVAERLEHEQVHAPLDERARLFAKELLGLVNAGLAPRLDADAERANRARHIRMLARGVPREPRTLQVDRVHLVRQAERAEFDSVRAERVRLDDVGAGAHVGLMHLGDEIRLP